MTPVDFKENYLTAFGSGFSVAPTFKQSAWFRFHNKAEAFVCKGSNNHGHW